MVVEIDGVKCLHISDFAYSVHRSVPSIRHLIFKGNSLRRMKAFRQRSSIYIPELEVQGFPFVDAGLFNGMIYHCVPKKNEDGSTYYVHELCKECTFTPTICENRKKAEELEIEIPDN